MDAESTTDGYEGVTHAGILVVARDSGAMLLAQRAMDDTDDESVQETWEMPGGGLDEGEDPLAGAIREFEEEVGTAIPAGEVVHGWRAGDDGHYQGFVYAVDAQIPIESDYFDREEVQNVGWFTPEEAATLPLRPEVAELDLAALIAYAVSGNEENTVSTMTPEDVEKVSALAETDPILTPAILADLAPGPVLVHGILCPEDTESGDGRGFNAGAVTARPLRLPFSWQKAAIGGHDGSVVVGSIDRVMRKDGLIHWEGSLLANEEAAEFIDLLVHFGRFGVSIDGDKGTLDSERSSAEQMTWFDSVRVAGTTAVAIPAFHEAYVALGPHPEMPADSTDEALTASGLVSGDLIGRATFDRGPGWVTNPTETKRLHDYWTKKGEPGYAKIAWGTNGDYTRCTRLVGEKIASNSPEDMRYLKRICAQWHHDALGYWPGDLDKPGNKTTAEARAERASSELAAAVEQVDREDIKATDDGWEAVLVSSAGVPVQPPLHYFHRPEALDDWSAGALTVCDPDENGIVRTYGYAAEWGVCHIGFDGRCVEPPRAGSDDYPEFHLGITRTAEGRITTGVLTYGVEHRDSDTILSESPQQCYFDNINNAWASVRIGEDERGIWFSGVVLPGVEADHLVKIEASGQVSGEWKHGALRACLTVNVPGFPVVRASATYDEDGNVLALAASAFGSVDNGTSGSECATSPAERMAALRMAHIEAEAETRFAALKKNWEG